MKILYMWIEDFQCMKKLGINFSNKYEFKFLYDKCQITISKKSKVLGGFFNILTDSEKIKMTATSIRYIKNISNNKIEDLCAIVGNNGAGKSTMLQLICDLYSRQLDSLPNGIYCLEKDNKIYIHSTLKKDIELINNVDIHISKCKLRVNKSINFYNYENFKIYNNKKEMINEEESVVDLNNSLIKEASVIYFSNEMCTNYYYKNYQPIKDISTSGLIMDDKRNDYENHKVSLDHSLLKCHADNEMIRQIEYIYSQKESDDIYLDFELPKQATVRFRNNDSIMMKIYQELDEKYRYNMDYSQIKIDVHKRLKENKEKELKQGQILLFDIYKFIGKFDMQNIVDRLPQSGTDESLYLQFSIKILIGIFISFCYEYIIVDISHKDNKNSLYESISKSLKEYLDKQDEKYIQHDRLYDDFIKILEDALAVIHLNAPDSVKKEDNEFIESINKFKDDISERMLNDTMNYRSMDNQFVLFTNNKESITNLKYFYEYYKITSKYNDYLDFSWGMSSGEYNMMSFFARMYSLIKHNQLINGKKLIILIDEADLSYHPSWQQKYIKNLICFLNTKFYEYKIQLILTTHSPILLSDIPKENVIFLKKVNGVTEVYENEEETFGANIYELYRNGFFLNNNNYGVIGDFATEKIQRVENILAKLLEQAKLINEKAEKEVKELLNNIDYINKDKIIVEKIEIIRNKMMDNVKKDYIKKLDECKKVIDIIGEEFIRNTLLKQYNQIYDVFNIQKEDDNEELKKIKSEFNKLSKDQQNELIKFIIDTRKN